MPARPVAPPPAVFTSRMSSAPVTPQLPRVFGKPEVVQGYIGSPPMAQDPRGSAPQAQPQAQAQSCARCGIIIGFGCKCENPMPRIHEARSEEGFTPPEHMALEQ